MLYVLVTSVFYLTVASVFYFHVKSAVLYLTVTFVLYLIVTFVLYLPVKFVLYLTVTSLLYLIVTSVLYLSVTSVLRGWRVGAVKGVPGGVKCHGFHCSCVSSQSVYQVRQLSYLLYHYVSGFRVCCHIYHFTYTYPFFNGLDQLEYQDNYFVCFPQLDTPSTPGVFVFTMKWGHACADLSLFV